MRSKDPSNRNSLWLKSKAVSQPFWRKVNNNPLRSKTLLTKLQWWLVQSQMKLFWLNYSFFFFLNPFKGGHHVVEKIPPGGFSWGESILISCLVSYQLCDLRQVMPLFWVWFFQPQDKGICFTGLLGGVNAIMDAEVLYKLKSTLCVREGTIIIVIIILVLISTEYRCGL